MHVSALLMALTTSVAAVSISRSEEPYFNVGYLGITSFAAAKSASYNLNVTFAGVSTSCSVTVQTTDLSEYCSSTAPYAPAITGFERTICKDPAFFWSLTPSDSLNGYSFSVNYTSTTGDILTGCRAIPETAFFCVSQGDEHAQDTESYAGPHSFTTDASTANVCVYS